MRFGREIDGDNIRARLNSCIELVKEDKPEVESLIAE